MFSSTAAIFPICKTVFGKTWERGGENGKDGLLNKQQIVRKQMNRCFYDNCFAQNCTTNNSGKGWTKKFEM